MSYRIHFRNLLGIIWKEKKEERKENVSTSFLSLFHFIFIASTVLVTLSQTRFAPFENKYHFVNLFILSFLFPFSFFLYYYLNDQAYLVLSIEPWITSVDTLTLMSHIMHDNRDGEKERGKLVCYFVTHSGRLTCTSAFNASRITVVLSYRQSYRHKLQKMTVSPSPSLHTSLYRQFDSLANRYSAAFYIRLSGSLRLVLVK